MSASSVAFDAWRARGRVHRHRGHAVFHVVEGAGPWLLVLHGFPSASWDWHPIWPDLVARFRAVAPDFIGFGWSDKPRGYDYSIADQATLCEDLLRAHGVDRVHVLAHDYGDTVAQELLARHEDRLRSGAVGPQIASLCFLNGGLFPEVHRARTVQRLLASRIGPLVARLTSRAAFGRGMTAIFGPDTPPSETFLDELWTLLRHADGQRVLHRLIGYMAERRTHRERWVGPLVTTKVPLRLVDGALDPVSGAHLAQRYREQVPNPDVVLLPRVGHYPQVEDPAGVLAAYLAFRDRVGQG